MKKTKTERGFTIILFNDIYDLPCSIQESSLATKSAVWLGVGTGIDRMHLDKTLAKKLIKVLEQFVATGDL
jgi:hypothetical protein